jgi:hypothetical protein
LPGLELGPGPGVLAQERRQRAEQPAEVGTAHLPGHPQRLHDPVADRIRQAGLQAVQALVEPPGRAVVLAKALERSPQLGRPAQPDLGERLGQRQAGPHTGREVVDDLRPEVAQLGPPLPSAVLHQGDRCVARHHRKGQSDRRRARHDVHEHQHDDADT